MCVSDSLLFTLPYCTHMIKVYDMSFARIVHNTCELDVQRRWLVHCSTCVAYDGCKRGHMSYTEAYTNWRTWNFGGSSRWAAERPLIRLALDGRLTMQLNELKNRRSAHCAHRVHSSFYNICICYSNSRLGSGYSLLLFGYAGRNFNQVTLG